MSEERRYALDGRVRGGEDIIATLSGRVNELSKRVALLQAELESATKRVAVYEEHDSTIQEALSGALRAAYQIRERAETAGQQILDQAREERRLLLNEIERLRDERDSLQDDIATQRRSGIGPVATRSLASDTVASELRSVASEALKGLFQEIVDDMRAHTPAASAPPTSSPQIYSPAASAATPAAPAEPLAQPPPTPSRSMIERPLEAAASTPQPTYDAMDRMKRTNLTEKADVAPPPAAEVAAMDRMKRTSLTERADVAPPPAAEVAAPALAALALVEVEDFAPPRVEAASPTSDIQLVISQVASFPRLVVIERHIQALPVVRTLFVRDFRGGTATLTVALRSAITPEEFAGMLADLTQPHLRLVSGSRNKLELRVEGEASIA